MGESPQAASVRILALQPAIDLVIEADRRFFLRRPYRSYRLRLASREELAEAEICCGITELVPQGYRAFVAVKHVSGGIGRAIGFAPEGTDTDVIEASARQYYAWLLTHCDATLRRLAGHSIKARP
ncbi:hypothetical protein [uncultured Methylobacterium sp.]|uniref:hypothetical protein n=1 Tax=uncultured Methylobacterium sp. TaxID=157278 RepID=UPI0035C9931D